MGSKSDFVPDSFIKALQRGNLGFKAWTERQQWHMAKLIWEEGLKRREHRRREGWITIGHKELERGFGRGGFAAMNAALAVFDVSENWHYRDGRSRKQNATRGYRLMPWVMALKEQLECLKAFFSENPLALIGLHVELHRHLGVPIPSLTRATGSALDPQINRCHMITSSV